MAFGFFEDGSQDWDDDMQRFTDDELYGEDEGPDMENPRFISIPEDEIDQKIESHRQQQEHEALCKQMEESGW